MIDRSDQPVIILSSHTLSSRARLPPRPLSATYTTHIWTQLNNKHNLSGDSLSVQPFSEPGPFFSSEAPPSSPRLQGGWCQIRQQNATPRQVGRWVWGTDGSFMPPAGDLQRKAHRRDKSDLSLRCPYSLERSPSCVLS